MLVHSVYFWLTDETTSQERKFFKAKLEALKDIACAEAVYVGTPAETDRPVIDRSYDYALTLIFRNINAHDEYQIDPLHKDFLQNCSKFFDKVVIYDAD